MDFLFDYYPYSPGRLGTWHPGLGMRLEGDWEPSSNADAYTHDGATWGVDPLTIDRARLALALGVLKGTPIGVDGVANRIGFEWEIWIAERIQTADTRGLGR